MNTPNRHCMRGDQVWDYFVCCKSKRQRGHTRLEMKKASPEMEEPQITSQGGPGGGSPLPQKHLPPMPIDTGQLEDIFGDISLDDDNGDFDISKKLDGNGRSDCGYGSDDLNSLASADSDTTVQSCDEITVIVSSEEDDTDPQEALGGKAVTNSSEGVKIPSSTANASLKKPHILDLLDPEGAYDDDSEFNIEPELRRSTSLKTNKTPPGTPRRKKVVRFADAFGLDLESVRHILNMNSPPRIPQSAVRDLKRGIEAERRSQGSKYFQALFSQPGATGNFVQRVLAQKVCLENAMINGMTITGTVRVANIGYHKKVTIRYTVNSWGTFADVQGSYVQGSCDGATDRFCFTVVSPGDVDIGRRLEFAISFEVEGQTYWDNNYGQNYVFECYARTVPTLSTDNAWVHFL